MRPPIVGSLRWGLFTGLALCGCLLVCGCTPLGQWVRNGFKVGPNYGTPQAAVADDWIDRGNLRVIDPQHPVYIAVSAASLATRAVSPAAALAGAPFYYIAITAGISADAAAWWCL